MADYDLLQYTILKTIETVGGRAESPIRIEQIPEDLKKWIRNQMELNGELSTLVAEGKTNIVEEGNKVFYKITDEGKKFVENTEKKLKEIQGANKETENKLQILKSPILLYYIKQVLDKSIVGEDKNKLLVFLLGLSSQLGSKDAQACYLIGQASSGKSYITHQTLTLLTDFVEEGGKLIWLTRSSTHGLEYYLNKFASLDGFILFIEEAPGFGDAQSSVRPMFSEKGLKIVIAEGGKNKVESREISVKGCPAFFTTSTTPIREEQMASRVWILQTDESEEHTKKVLKFTKMKVSNLDIENQIEQERQKLKDTLKLLQKPDGILIPYAEAMEFPTSQVRVRRDFNKFCSLIKVSAYLHQYQRPWVKKEGKRYILATFADYYIAYSLMHSLLKPVLYGLPENVLKLLDVCREIKEDEEDITVKKVTYRTNYSQTTVRAYLDALVDAGLLVKEKEGRENHYYLRSEKNFVDILKVEDIAKKYNKEKFKNWQVENFEKVVCEYNTLFENIYSPEKGRVLACCNPNAKTVLHSDINTEPIIAGSNVLALNNKTILNNNTTSKTIPINNNVLASEIIHNKNKTEEVER